VSTHGVGGLGMPYATPRAKFEKMVDSLKYPIKFTVQINPAVFTVKTKSFWTNSGVGIDVALCLQRSLLS